MATTNTEAARYEKRRTAVEAVARGEAVADVARMLGIPRRTVFHWVALYRSGGLHALQEGKRSGRPRKVSGEVMEWLYTAITKGDPRQFQLEFCLWTLALVRTLLKQRFDIEISKSGVSRLLRHLGLSAQHPLFRSHKQDPAAVQRYLKRRFPQIVALAKKKGAAILFVDEAGVRADQNRGTTWGKVGETPVVQANGARFSLGLISAVGSRGEMYFEVFEGRMNGTRFVEFLQRLHLDVGRPIIVILDNVSYHKSGLVKKFIRSRKGDIIAHYLPEYSPELNPDELVWNSLKARLSRLFIETKAQLRAEVERLLLGIRNDRKLITSFFRLATTKYALMP